MKSKARVRTAWMAIPAASSLTCRAAWMAPVVVITITSTAWLTAAHAAIATPTTKGEEVSTVGTAPYLGPLPEELAKLAELEVAEPASSGPDKEPSVDTITHAGANTLTEAEMAKAAALSVIAPVLPEWLMLKLAPMQLSKDGTPQLTAPERAKRAAELNASPTAPRSTR